MSEVIRHIGAIDAVGKGSVEVRILQGSACASCQAAKLCRSSESREHVVTVPVADDSQYAVGQQVLIEAPLRMGLRAVWWAYVYPLAVLLLTVMLAAVFGASEPVTALLGLLSVAVAMLTLYVRRDALRREFVFKIK